MNETGLSVGPLPYPGDECWGRVAVPLGLSGVSEICKDNAEQLWLRESSDHQQFLTAAGNLQSSRQLPRRCFCFMFPWPEAVHCLNYIRFGGGLRLRVDGLSFSSKTRWWITGYLVTHLPASWIFHVSPWNIAQCRLESGDFYYSGLAKNTQINHFWTEDCIMLSNEESISVSPRRFNISIGVSTSRHLSYQDVQPSQ